MSQGPLARSARSAGGEQREGRTDRARGIGAALVAGTILVTGVVVWFVQRHTPVPPRTHTGEVGSIIYAARSSNGETRLYRWNLLTDAVSRGPVVHDLTGLFDASAAHPGWVGETSSGSTGGVAIGVFQFLGPEDQPVPLGHGDVAAWAPYGADAAIATTQAAPGGCGRLYVTDVHIAPIRHSQDAGVHLCSSVEGIQLGQTKTYVWLHDAQGSRITFTSAGQLRTELEGYRLDSLSPANDMIVTRDPPAGSPSDAVGALYFQGLDPPTPIPYALARHPFVLDRVLAWAPDGSEALALGSAGQRTGFFRLTSAPPTGGATQPATYIGPATGFSNALYTGVTRIIFTNGTFSRVFDGSMKTFPLPAGAPEPSGPMVWVGA